MSNMAVPGGGFRLCRVCGHPKRYHGTTVQTLNGPRRIAPNQTLARLTSKHGGSKVLVCAEFEESYLVEGVL